MEELNDRIKALMSVLKDKRQISDAQTTEMFALHNLYYPNHQEHGRSCSSCRGRVYGKMLKIYNGLPKTDSLSMDERLIQMKDIVIARNEENKK